MSDSDYLFHQLTRNGKLKLKHAFYIWRLHREEGLPLPVEVQEKLFTFLDQQAEKPQYSYKYDPDEVDRQFLQQCFIVLMADKIYDEVVQMTKQGKNTEYIFRELARKYRKSLLGQKSWQYWRDLYYSIKEQKEA